MGEMNQKDFKPFKLREKNVDDLVTSVDELQRELSTLKANKVTSGVASKVAKIRVVRKAIARTLTMINDKKRTQVKDAYKSRAALKAYNESNKTNWRISDKPYACRERTTRAKRRALTKKQQNLTTLRQRKQNWNFPQRVYAVRA